MPSAKVIRMNKMVLTRILGFPGGSVRNLPAVWETWVRSLGWEDKNFKEGGNGTIRLLKKQLEIMKKI